MHHTLPQFLPMNMFYMLMSQCLFMSLVQVSLSVQIVRRCLELPSVSFPSAALAALRATISTDAFVPGKSL